MNICLSCRHVRVSRMLFHTMIASMSLLQVSLLVLTKNLHRQIDWRQKLESLPLTLLVLLHVHRTCLRFRRTWMPYLLRQIGLTLLFLLNLTCVSSWRISQIRKHRNVLMLCLRMHVLCVVQLSWPTILTIRGMQTLLTGKLHRWVHLTSRLLCLVLMLSHKGTVLFSRMLLLNKLLLWTIRLILIELLLTSTCVTWLLNNSSVHMKLLLHTKHSLR